MEKIENQNKCSYNCIDKLRPLKTLNFYSSTVFKILYDANFW